MKKNAGSWIVCEDKQEFVLHESSPIDNSVEPTDDSIFSRNSSGIKEQKELEKALDNYLTTPGKKFCDIIVEYISLRRI